MGGGQLHCGDAGRGHESHPGPDGAGGWKISSRHPIEYMIWNIWLVSFCNFPFNIFGQRLTTGNWNCEKQNCRWGGRHDTVLQTVLSEKPCKCTHRFAHMWLSAGWVPRRDAWVFHYASSPSFGSTYRPGPLCQGPVKLPPSLREVCSQHRWSNWHVSVWLMSCDKHNFIFHHLSNICLAGITVICIHVPGLL